MKRLVKENEMVQVTKYCLKFIFKDDLSREVNEVYFRTKQEAEEYWRENKSKAELVSKGWEPVTEYVY